MIRSWMRDPSSIPVHTQIDVMSEWLESPQNPANSAVNEAYRVAGELNQLWKSCGNWLIALRLSFRWTLGRCLRIVTCALSSRSGAQSHVHWPRHMPQHMQNPVRSDYNLHNGGTSGYPSRVSG